MPSRVLHIRKLPNDITETEVISLGLPFGDVTNLLMLKAKNQVQNVDVFFFSSFFFQSGFLIDKQDTREAQVTNTQNKS